MQSSVSLAEKPEQTSVTFRLPLADYRTFAERCQSSDRSVSQALRALIREANAVKTGGVK